MAQPETGGVKSNIDIRDEQFENTQREDWLLPTEPRHGARPRQTGGERPPVTENPAFRDAAEISAIRHPSRTLRLSPGRRIFMEEEVFTPPMGGGCPAPEPQGVQREVRAVPKIFPEEIYSDIHTSRRPHVEYVAERLCSPVGQLEKAVVRLQRDITNHHTELRLRTQTPDSGPQTDSGPQRKKIR